MSAKNPAKHFLMSVTRWSVILIAFGSLSCNKTEGGDSSGAAWDLGGGLVDRVEDVGVDAGEPLSNLLERHCARSNREACRHFYECEWNPEHWHSDLFGGVEPCVEWKERVGCRELIAVERGNATVDAQKLAECLDLEPDSDVCTDSAYAACVSAAVQPTGEDGERCFSPVECASGHCITVGPWDSACYSRHALCGELPGPGEVCFDYDQCPDGFYCDEICRPRLAQGTECSGYEQCVAGLGCFALPDEPFSTCQPPLELGETCLFSPSHSTSEGLPCRGGYCHLRSWKCEEFKRPGEPCSGRDQCSFGGCPLEEICPTRALIGQPCRPETTFCEGNSECVEGTCQPWSVSVAGQPCERAADCQGVREYCSEHGCYRRTLRFPTETCVDQICVPRGSEGEPCEQNDHCQLPLVCDSSVCRPEWRAEKCQ